MFESIGWVATAIFAGSYFCKRPTTLRRLQALAAVLWIGYGLVISSAPVIASNVAVAFLALYSSWRRPGEVAGSGPGSHTRG